MFSTFICSLSHLCSFFLLKKVKNLEYEQIACNSTWTDFASDSECMNTWTGSISAWINSYRSVIFKELFIAQSLQNMVKKMIKSSNPPGRHWSFSLVKWRRPHPDQGLFDMILACWYHEYSGDVTDLDLPPKGHKINKISRGSFSLLLSF